MVTGETAPGVGNRVAVGVGEGRVRVGFTVAVAKGRVGRRGGVRVGRGVLVGEGDAVGDGAGVWETAGRGAV